MSKSAVKKIQGIVKPIAERIIDRCDNVDDLTTGIILILIAIKKGEYIIKNKKLCYPDGTQV